VNNQKTTILFIALCILSLFLVERENNQENFLSLESSYVNWLIDTKKQKKYSPSITLLTLDDSEESVIQDWPPSPLDYAVILNNLKTHNPKLVAIEPSLEFPNGSEGLIETLRTACLSFNQESLLLSAICQMDQSFDPASEKGENFFDSILTVNGNTDKVPEFTKINSFPDQRFAAMGLPIAFTSIDLSDYDQDGNNYTFPLIARIGKKIVPSFVLKAIMLENNIKANQVIINLGNEIKLGDKKIIPIDDTGRVIIYPALQGELSKERINLLTVPTIELDEKKRSLLKNNVLLIGNDQDSANIKNIPFRQNSIISNAELMALAISTIQSELYISELTKNTEVFVWIVLIFLGVLIFKYYPKKAISRIGLLILIYLSFNMVLFQSNGQWISPLPPLVLFALMTVFAFFLPKKKAS
tara:strand:- start:127 stop:1368 length:1242 start_codon:yes stop_codon:yes gene_type:complete